LLEAVCGTTLESSESASIFFVVTNLHFSNIGSKTDLANEVGDLLLKAVGGADLKDAIPSRARNQKEKIGDTEIVATFNGSEYCYYSPDTDKWEWKTCSSKGWSVFVKDAEDVKEKISERCGISVDLLDNFAGTDLATRCEYVCDPIKEIIDETYGSREYQNYLLTVKFKDSECEGLSGYGTAYIEHWQNMMNPLKNPIGMITYAATCGTTTSVCYAAMTAGTGGIAGALTLGKVAKDMFLCGLAPAITGWFASQQIEESKTQAQASFILAQTLGAGELMTAKYAVLPTVQISRLRSAIRGGADLVKAVSKDTAKFDDFVKLGVRYTETADQFDKIVSKFPNFTKIRSGAYINDKAEDVLRLLAEYKKNPAVLKDIGSRLGIEDAAELVKTEDGKKKLMEEIVDKLKKQKIGDAANKAFKGMDDELRNVVKKEFKASFVCGAAGAVAGTLSYYALIAETGTITTPSLTVEIDNIFDAMSVAVSNNRIDVGA